MKGHIKTILILKRLKTYKRTKSLINIADYNYSLIFILLIFKIFVRSTNEIMREKYNNSGNTIKHTINKNIKKDIDRKKENECIITKDNF